MFYFNCILVCTGLVGASRKSPCSVIIIIIIKFWVVICSWIIRYKKWET